MRFKSENEELNRIKAELGMGLISLAEAKKRAKPYIETLNNFSRETARKFGMKPRLFSFGSLMR